MLVKPGLSGWVQQNTGLLGRLGWETSRQGLPNLKSRSRPAVEQGLLSSQPGWALGQQRHSPALAFREKHGSSLHHVCSLSHYWQTPSHTLNRCTHLVKHIISTEDGIIHILDDSATGLWLGFSGSSRVWARQGCHLEGWKEHHTSSSTVCILSSEPHVTPKPSPGQRWPRSPRLCQRLSPKQRHYFWLQLLRELRPLLPSLMVQQLGGQQQWQPPGWQPAGPWQHECLSEFLLEVCKHIKKGDLRSPDAIRVSMQCTATQSM